MEAIKLKFQDSFFSRPFRVYGTTMQPSLLLMCKILVLLLFAHGYFFYIRDPFVPFLPSLDIFNTIPFLFEYMLKAVFVLTGIMLCFNIKVRLMAVGLGLVIFLSLLGSKSLFRNHLFIVGCMLFLSGLSEKSQVPWLIYFQLSLVYFGALINKMLEIDWWTGQFMHNWLSEALNNSFYITLSESVPEKLFAKLISYSAMLVELIIGIFLIIPRLRFYAIALILVFHTMLFTFTGESFGFFMEDILIILIAFTTWSNKKMILKYKHQKLSAFFKAIAFLDWDNRIVYQCEPEQANRLELKLGNKILINAFAFTKILVCSTGFFYMLLFVQLGIKLVFNGQPRYFAMFLFLWFLLLLLSPFIIYKFKNRKGVSSF